MIMISRNFIFNFVNFCVIARFFNTLLKLHISTAVRTVVVAKLVILVILVSGSFILALRIILLAMLLILCILFLTSFILVLKVVI